MRRILPIVTTTAALGLVASSPAMAAPKHDIVTGRGEVGNYSENVHVNARSGPNGENPRGSFHTDFIGPGPADWHVPVSCMIVQDDLAVVGGLERKDGREVFMVIRDNGDNPDQVAHVFRAATDTPPDQELCELIITNIAPISTATGDFTVEDN
jgi:hypothetical protein